MMHGGITPDGDILDILLFKTKIRFPLLRHLNPLNRAFFPLFLFYLLLGRIRACYGLIDQRIERFHNVVAHLFKAPRIHHVIRDATHHILTIFALRVHHGNRVHDLHGGQIAKICRHGRGSDIYGQTVAFFSFSRLHANDFPIHPNTYRNLPALLPQYCRQFSERLNIDPQVFETVSVFQFGADPFKITGGFLK